MNFINLWWTKILAPRAIFVVYIKENQVKIKEKQNKIKIKYYKFLTIYYVYAFFCIKIKNKVETFLACLKMKMLWQFFKFLTKFLKFLVECRRMCCKIINKKNNTV